MTYAMQFMYTIWKQMTILPLEHAGSITRFPVDSVPAYSDKIEETEAVPPVSEM